MNLPLDAPLPRQAGLCLPLQEAIEQRARAFGVPVDARIERGRTSRHALRQTIAHERYNRIVVAAGGLGFGPDDVAWLLAHAQGEIIVLRPGSDDRLPPTDGPQRGRRRGGKADRNLRDRAAGETDGPPAAAPLSAANASGT